MSRVSHWVTRASLGDRYERNIWTGFINNLLSFLILRNKCCLDFYSSSLIILHHWWLQTLLFLSHFYPFYFVRTCVLCINLLSFYILWHSNCKQYQPSVLLIAYNTDFKNASEREQYMGKLHYLLVQFLFHYLLVQFLFHWSFCFLKFSSFSEVGVFRSYHWLFLGPFLLWRSNLIHSSPYFPFYNCYCVCFSWVYWYLAVSKMLLKITHSSTIICLPSLAGSQRLPDLVFGLWLFLLILNYPRLVLGRLLISLVFHCPPRAILFSLLASHLPFSLRDHEHVSFLCDIVFCCKVLPIVLCWFNASPYWSSMYSWYLLLVTLHSFIFGILFPNYPFKIGL